MFEISITLVETRAKSRALPQSPTFALSFSALVIFYYCGSDEDTELLLNKKSIKLIGVCCIELCIYVVVLVYSMFYSLLYLHRVCVCAVS
jgi:hypothetical protein